MIAITIDCEQWNSPAIRGKKDRYNDTTIYSFEGNKKLLKILDKHNIPATFFVTGKFAEEQKQQLKEISEKHEIACHGYCHFYRGNPNLDLEQDITKAKEIIGKVIRKKVLGFRAPQMQFSNELIKILDDLSFKYDSSLHAANIPGFYNNKHCSLKPFKIGKVIEIPASASYKFRLPISWVFMRNLPLIYSIRIIKKLLKKGITPVLYFHSWEFYEIKSKQIPFYITWNTGKKFSRKFEKFLEIFKDEKFIVMDELTKPSCQ